jgi:hypothetical protein
MLGGGQRIVFLIPGKNNPLPPAVVPPTMQAGVPYENQGRHGNIHIRGCNACSLGFEYPPNVVLKGDPKPRQLKISAINSNCHGFKCSSTITMGK